MSKLEREIEALFMQLGKWRNLPSYRLEPRADPFFALFMQEVVAAHIGQPVSPVMLPEFPIRRGALYGDDCQAPNASVKVDYALFSKAIDRVFFIELKTDQASRRAEQDDYLVRAANVGFSKLLEGILLCAQATDSKSLRKYAYLISELEKLGFLLVPRSFYADAFASPPRGAAKHLRNAVINRPELPKEIAILYVQPRDTGENTVSFDEFAHVIEHQSELGALFSRRLRDWGSPPAHVPPQDRR